MQKPKRPSGRETAATTEPAPVYLEIPLPCDDGSQFPVDGIPDLAGTRWLCFGAAVLCFFFTFWLPVAVIGAADRFSPNNTLLVGLLVFIAMALSGAMTVYLVRAGLAAGAWFRVDGEGFGYGAGPSGAAKVSDGAGAPISWSQIERRPERRFDVGIAAMHRSEVLSPRMTFWYRSDDGTLTQRSVPLQLRDDVLGCLRFRNGHAVRVALLQGLARQGLRFSPDVFAEAGVDPESWRPMKSPRLTQWLAVIATLAVIFLTVRVTWSTTQIVFCTLAIIGFGYWATVALARRDPRLTGIIAFVPPRAK